MSFTKPEEVRARFRLKQINTIELLISSGTITQPIKAISLEHEWQSD
jgi:hypothetical protein